MSRHSDRFTDPLHPGVSFNAHHQAEPTVDFDFDSIDRFCFGVPDESDTIDFSDTASALPRILEWCLKPTDQVSQAGRVAIVQYMLNSGQSRHGSLQEIGNYYNPSKQFLSRMQLEFKSLFGVQLYNGKKDSTRQRFRDAQYRSIEAGTHRSVAHRGSYTNNHGHGSTVADEISLEAVGE
jgi:hypothetical protein